MYIHIYGERERERGPTPCALKSDGWDFFACAVLLSSLELSDTRVYGLSIRSRRGTAPHFRKVGVRDCLD